MIVANVSCFKLFLTANEDNTLRLRINVRDPLNVGLNHEHNFNLHSFDLDWNDAYAQFKVQMEEWQSVEFSHLKINEENFVRPNNNLVVKVTGFAGGCFGTAILDEKTVVVGRASSLEAQQLADMFGKEQGTDFLVVSSGQRPTTPFWEYHLNYSLTPKVEEFVENGETFYRFKERGEEQTYKVTESTCFGDDIRVDKAFCVENELTFNQGVASYATDVISAYINRNRRKAA